MNQISDYCITKNYTIKEVMEVLQRIKERGVVVLGDDEKVCGVLSQGDIINALVNGRNVFSRIDGIYTENYIYLNDSMDEKAIEYFKKRNLCLIPIIDSDFKLIDILTARELMKKTFCGKT